MPFDARMLTDLRQDGIVYAPALQSVDMWAIKRHISDSQGYNAHVAAKATEAPRPVWRVLDEKAWPCFSVDLEAIVLAPFFFEYVLGFLDMAEQYFGEPAYLYSMNAFGTQPAPTEYSDTHDWHRDTDDRKQFVIFVYASDVLHSSDGAHMYQIGTHELADDRLGRSPSAPTPNVVRTITGLSGHAFVADTRGLHRGNRPASRPRLLLWARYGVSKPPAGYYWDKLKPVDAKLLGHRYPTNAKLREAISLIVA